MRCPAPPGFAPSVHRKYRARRSLPGGNLPVPLSLKGGAKHMIKWNYRATRIALVLGAIAAFAVASGASTKWV